MSRVAVLVAAGWVGLWSAPAEAFPWMMKHGYAACAACHVDPSGGGQLTTFGRTESERLLRWMPVKPKPGEDPVPRTANFLWFLELPEEVNLSGSIRLGALVQPGGPMPVIPLEKAFDLSATFTIAETLVLHATAGFGRGNFFAPAVLLPACDEARPGGCGPSLVSRTYWAGLKLADNTVLVRAGRLAVPFGLRNVEHTAWVRSFTRTDSNVSQQLGAAAAYMGGNLRADVMGLAGGLTSRYREGGYAATVEYGFSPKLYLGASSLVSHGPLTLDTLSPEVGTRHAHGLSLRWAVDPSLVLLAEATFLAWLSTPEADRFGYAAFAQADWEPVQGLHLLLTAESAHRGRIQRGPSAGVWLSAAWYFFSHLELRVDNILRHLEAGMPLSYALVAQLHAYL
jgi:hypothetical protein